MRQTTNNIARYVLMFFALALAPRLAGGVVAAENENQTVTLDGDGTSTNPYKIESYSQLLEFADLVNKGQKTDACAVLTADIDTENEFIIDGSGNLTNTPKKNWIPIGNSYSNRYTGTFDGQGHTISRLYVNDNNKDLVGLFGYLGESGIIRNVGVETSHFYNGKQFVCVGGVCGNNFKGTIENCYNEGTTVNGTGKEAYVGGVCGNNNYGTIKNCYNNGRKVSGTGNKAYIGGVCGNNNYNCTIENCYNIGEVSGTETSSYIGGVCGNNNNSTIKNCYNAGKVSGPENNSNVGEVCGYNIDNNSTIENCYFLQKKETTKKGIGKDENSSSSSVTGIDENKFKSGEVAWLLNGNKDDNATTSPWLQDLSGEEDGGDQFPVLKTQDAKCIAVVKNGTSTDATYTNPADHNYNNDNPTFADFPDYGTANLYSHVCDYCKGASKENPSPKKKKIKQLNSADDADIEITMDGENGTTSANITLGDNATDNWYHAPVEFTTTGKVSYKRKMSGNKWATICLPYKIIAKNNDCKFYELSDVTTDNIVLTEITGTTAIEAGTPVFVKANNNVNEIDFSVTDATMVKEPKAGKAAGGYTLTGAFELTTLKKGSSDLFIKDDYMWNMSQPGKDMKVRIFRAYLKDISSGANGAPQRSIVIDGEATAISDALDTLNDTNAEYYDINGRRINSLQKGVNIVKSGNKTRKIIVQ